MTGTFDGRRFTPDGPKRYYAAGLLYAPQTFNGLDSKNSRDDWGRRHSCLRDNEDDSKARRFGDLRPQSQSEARRQECLRPQSRRIQIAWAKIRHDGMPFTGMMLLPTERLEVFSVKGIW